MEIIRQYGINDDKRKLYNLTQTQDLALTELVGQRIEIKSYVLYGTMNSEGNPVQVLKLELDDGKIAATTSAAFIRGFCDFLDVMGSDEMTECEITQRLSKQGRKYIAFKA